MPSAANTHEDKTKNTDRNDHAHMKNGMPGRCSVFSLIVILESQMGNQRFAAQVPQRVLQLHELDEKVVLRIEPRRRHGGLQIEAQPLLDAQPPQLMAALREVEEQDQVEHD